MKGRRLVRRFFRRHHSTRTHSVPFYARIVMLLEAAIIGFFIFWTAEQYNNDQYFQGYVNNTLQNNLVVIEIGATIAAFLGAFFLAEVRRAQLSGRVSLEVVGNLGQNQGQFAAESERAGTAEASGKSGGGPPALAAAAARVLKRMGPAQGSLTQPLFQKNKLVLKQVEPEHPAGDQRREVTPEERRLRTIIAAGSRQGPGEKPPHRTTPPIAAPALQSVEIRQTPPPERNPSLSPPGLTKPLGQTDATIARSISPKPATVITSIELTQDTRDKRYATQPSYVSPRTETTRTSEQSPPNQESILARPPKIVPGPLENPVPDNALIPIAKTLPPRVETPITATKHLPLSEGTGLEHSNTSPLSPTKSTSTRPTQSVAAVADKHPAEASPLAAQQEKSSGATRPLTVEIPPVRPLHGQSDSADNAARVNPRLVTAGTGPILKPSEEPSGRKPLAGFGRVEPVRGVMDKPFGLKPVGPTKKDNPTQDTGDRQSRRPSSFGEPNQTELKASTTSHTDERPTQDSPKPAGNTDEKPLYQKRPLAPKRSEHHDPEDDETQII